MSKRDLCLAIWMAALLPGCKEEATTCQEVQLPSRAISVDGNTDDWRDVSPLLTDARGDVRGPYPGLDLKAFYLAVDSKEAPQKLFFRIDLYGDLAQAPPDGGTRLDASVSGDTLGLALNFKSTKFGKEDSIEINPSNPPVGWLLNSSFIQGLTSANLAVTPGVVEGWLPADALGDMNSMAPTGNLCCYWNPDHQSRDPLPVDDMGCVWWRR